MAERKEEDKDQDIKSENDDDDGDDVIKAEEEDTFEDAGEKFEDEVVTGSLGKYLANLRDFHGVLRVGNSSIFIYIVAACRGRKGSRAIKGSRHRGLLTRMVKKF